MVLVLPLKVPLLLAVLVVVPYYPDGVLFCRDQQGLIEERRKSKGKTNTQTHVNKSVHRSTRKGSCFFLLLSPTILACLSV